MFGMMYSSCASLPCVHIVFSWFTSWRISQNSFLSRDQFSRDQLPWDQLSRDQLVTRSTQFFYILFYGTRASCRGKQNTKKLWACWSVFDLELGITSIPQISFAVTVLTELGITSIHAASLAGHTARGTHYGSHRWSCNILQLNLGKWQLQTVTMELLWLWGATNKQPHWRVVHKTKEGESSFQYFWGVWYVMKKEQASSEMKLEQLELGSRAPLQKKRIIEKDEQISALFERFKDYLAIT